MYTAICQDFFHWVVCPTRKLITFHLHKNGRVLIFWALLHLYPSSAFPPNSFLEMISQIIIPWPSQLALWFILPQHSQSYASPPWLLSACLVISFALCKFYSLNCLSSFLTWTKGAVYTWRVWAMANRISWDPTFWMRPLENPLGHAQRPLFIL